MSTKLGADPLGPLIGGVAFATVFLSSLLGFAPWSLFWLVVAASAGLGFLNSALAVLLEESAYHRFSRTRDVLNLLAAGAIEPVWFHAAHAWWRTIGLVRAVTRRKAEWGTQQRAGFTPTRSR
ncbi:hypothetical protein GCM10023065_11480 [Microbacterium laevaniformans]|uniref:hypothetical protein n=1 Tax=Microbacterium laevaniformans TaxID=36807 RepID=UPI00195CD087|nr:hypothetical protein [Microbacterium laevaniformans]MBM7752098.1 hypothetical protein [Microbacterium laevaniformans]GLJ64847.1 hypothetical protein GCM10017578_17360 [Microbacterium laevaniformans]